MSRIIALLVAVLAGFLAMTSYAKDEIDSKYFSRNTRYMMLKDKLVLVERNRPGVVTMDEWPQLVFLGADGEHSVGEFIAALGKQYQGGSPPGLAEQTRGLVKDLAARGYVVLHERKQKLPYYLAIPVEEQDKERAKVQMEADGFIKKAAK